MTDDFKGGCIIDPLHRQVILIGGLDQGQLPPFNPIKDGIENQGVICDLWVFFDIISLKAF